MEKSRKFLQKIGMPSEDVYSLTPTEKRFPDGAQYRFEVPGIEDPETMRRLLKELEKEQLIVHRITQTKGVFLLTDNELLEMAALAKEFQVQLLLAIGPRATTDLSASSRAPEGDLLGYRLRGQEQIVRAMEEVRRGLRFGCTHFLVYDEGSLWVFNKMREKGEIPAECHFKVSANAGYGNPCSLRMLEEAGADSINPVWDLPVSMLAAIRQAIAIPMDIHIENPKSTGGFIRYYEVPDMIKTVAPIYLKMAGSVEQEEPDLVKQHIRQLKLSKQMISAYYPEAMMSEKGSIK